MQLPDSKHCPICENDLPVDSFGLCRARKDGKNLYCRSCIKTKVAAARVVLKQIKASRKAAVLRNKFFDRKPYVIAILTPAEKVLKAISNGARTQDQIHVATRLCKDDIGDALAELMLDRGEVVTQSVGENRYYFLKVEKKPEVRSGSLGSLACLGPVIRGARAA